MIELTERGIVPMFSVEDVCFKEQIEFIRDPARYKTAVCSRRAGKTVACAVDLLESALHKPGGISLYLTLVRLNAERLVWPELLRVNRLYGLGGIPNYSKLSLTFPNEHVIYCSGAKDKTEIEKFRGLALTKVYLDESQSFRSHIRELVDDVLSKALFDHNGTLCLIGTPGPVQAGYYWEATQSDEWSHHHWTMIDNPHLEAKSGKPAMKLIEEDIKRMGITMDHPKVQRECFGLWAVDTSSLVFQYNRSINSYSDLPVGLTDHIVGIDIGFHDSDAIAVLGWKKHDTKVYLVEEIITAKQDITALMHQIKSLEKKYDPLAIVMDTGGLGRKIAEELQARHELPVRAAEKSRKFEYIELLNDALRTGRFQAKENSGFVQDCNLIEWDRDKSNPERLVISDRYHSDIADAVLYAFRESFHWLEVPSAPVYAARTPEWFIEQERLLEEQAELALKQSQDENQWEDSWN